MNEDLAEYIEVNHILQEAVILESNENRQKARHLAWHETLELHELTASQTTGLIKLKRSVGQIQDSELKTLYRECIRDLEANLRELLRFYSMAPREEEDADRVTANDGFYVADLLVLTKSQIKAYASGISETATPELRDVFSKHLQKAIRAHSRVFNYMHKNGMYPAYDLERLLEGDVKRARNALNMRES